MISVLIPNYNYNAVPLVNEVFEQVIANKIKFEILVFDDNSQDYDLKKTNNSINTLENCCFKKLNVNIGRSAIRNLLAKNAKYDSLLFIDSGTYPKEKHFISSYLKVKNKGVVIGGMAPLKDTPRKPYKLRWLYTKKRESWNQSKSNNTYSSSNFFIKKDIFLDNLFDESLKKYGCEDVLFFNSILKKNIAITHIDNPVLHDANDDANTFLKKTEHALENLITLLENKKLDINNYNISIVYNKLSRVKVCSLIILLFKLFKPLMVKNFNSNFPSIFLYDFYRLGYFSLLKSKKQ